MTCVRTSTVSQCNVGIIYRMELDIAAKTICENVFITEVTTYWSQDDVQSWVHCHICRLYDDKFQQFPFCLPCKGVYMEGMFMLFR